VIDSEQGILFFEGSVMQNTNCTIALADSASSPTKSWYIRFNSNNKIQATYNGVTSVSPTDYDLNTNYKVVARYGGGNIDLFVNGVEIASNSVSAYPENSLTMLNALLFASQTFFGRIKQIKHLPYSTNIENL
jgi:hypothetical protein